MHMYMYLADQLTTRVEALQLDESIAPYDSFLTADVTGSNLTSWALLNTRARSAEIFSHADTEGLTPLYACRQV